jgi:hypothetical protein
VGRARLRLRRVELLVDVRLLADEILGPADRFGEILTEREDAEAVVRLVPDPPARRLELREGLPELVDRCLRLEDVPDEEAEDQPITAT